MDAHAKLQALHEVASRLYHRIPAGQGGGGRFAPKNLAGMAVGPTAKKTLETGLGSVLPSPVASVGAAAGAAVIEHIAKNRGKTIAASGNLSAGQRQHVKAVTDEKVNESLGEIARRVGAKTLSALKGEAAANAIDSAAAELVRIGVVGALADAMSMHGSGLNPLVATGVGIGVTLGTKRLIKMARNRKNAPGPGPGLQPAFA